MNITFQQIMDFYPVHNESVFEELIKTFSDSLTSIVPFVGAGLSAFCNYPNQPKALNTLSDLVYEEEKRKHIKKKISEYELLEAAQDTETEISLRNMLSQMQYIFDYEAFSKCQKEDIEFYR